jgi:predicted nucleotidyltransferase
MTHPACSQDMFYNFTLSSLSDFSPGRYFKSFVRLTPPPRHRPAFANLARMTLADSNMTKTPKITTRDIYGSLSEATHQALAEVSSRAQSDPIIIGLILTGSAGRGMATQHSDVDVIVIRDEAQSAPTREVTHSSAIDEIPMTLTELETIKPVGSEGAWERWSFAWAKILYDSSCGRVSDGVRRQPILNEQEIQDLLIRDSRLDEYINFTYRALKSHRDGRADAARLDSAESIASFLDVLFALCGRVRPYNKYLAWEMGEHPLTGLGEDWNDGGLMRRVNGLLQGSEHVMREMFTAIEKECRAYDLQIGKSMMSEVIDGWDEELKMLRGLPGNHAASIQPH